MRALVVEPSATLSRVLRNALRAAGCDQVVEVSTATAALEQLASGVDALITEWELPDLAGAELIRSLRQNPGPAMVPVLVVSERGMRGDVEQAAELGVSGFLLKPLEAESLRQRIAILVAAAAEGEAKAA